MSLPDRDEIVCARVMPESGDRFVGLSDMELVALQYELRKSEGDRETLYAVLIELGRRQWEVDPLRFKGG